MPQAGLALSQPDERWGEERLDQPLPDAPTRRRASSPRPRGETITRAQARAEAQARFGGWAELSTPPLDLPEADPATGALQQTDPRARELRQPGGGIPGRRTVTITGHGADRYRTARRPARRAEERVGLRPDRMAMWAVLLGVLMILAAATSSHAAVPHPVAVAHLHALSLP